MKKILLILTILLSSLAVSGQEMVDSLSVYFRQGLSEWDPSYMDNGARMSEFVERVKSVQSDSGLDIVAVIYEAKASPEGPHDVNVQLAEERAEAIRTLLSSVINLSEGSQDMLFFTEDYARLAELVEASSMPYRDEVLEVLEDVRYVSVPTEQLSESIKLRLGNIADGEAWNYIYGEFFPILRRFLVQIRIGVSSQGLVLVAVPPHFDDKMAYREIPQYTPTEMPEVVDENWWQRSLYVKTNAVGWALFVSNIAVEVDLSRKLSLNFPIYYSGMNYFSSRRKLRMFGCYPELRYWFKGVQSDGFFVGAHFGCALYNYALSGEWRIQDHSGETPALGGGINAGYRMGLGKKNRWCVEFTLGAGVYDLRYDKFYNVDNGLRAERNIHETKFMLDHVGVSFGYRFNLNKR